MKNKNRFTGFIVIALATVLILSGCGAKGSGIAGTYKYQISPEQLEGQTSHNGFISALGASQINTLVLNDDGTYEYTKQIVVLNDSGKVDSNGINLTHKFTGKYTSEDFVVTLESPEDNEFDENWASLSETGYLLNSSGKASAGDLVQVKEDEFHKPLDLFLTEYYLDSEKHDSSVVVTVDKETSTFTYNETKSSDDE